VETMEATIEQLNDSLRALDVQGQKPRKQLTETAVRLNTLRSELEAAQLRLKNTAGQDLVALKREISTLQSGVADLQREADWLKSKLKRIDNEAAGYHAQILECGRPGDEEKLRESYDAFCKAMDSARITGAEFFMGLAAHERKYSEAGRLAGKQLREAFNDREGALRQNGWRDLDAVSVPIGLIEFKPMLPPAGKL
jgi:chromosome segregation ATPase